MNLTSLRNTQAYESAVRPRYEVAYTTTLFRPPSDRTVHITGRLHYNHHEQMGTNFGRQIAWVTEFWTMVLNTCGSSIWTWLRINLLTSRILKWLLDFWKIPTVVSPILPGSTDKIFGSVALQVSVITGHGGRRHIFISYFSVFIILGLLACDAVSLGESFPTFRNIVLPSTARPQAPNDPKTQRHSPEQPIPQQHTRN